MVQGEEMIEFILGFITGMTALFSIAILDVALFKDKFINKKIQDFRVYLYASFIEILMFAMGFLTKGFLK